MKRAIIISIIFTLSLFSSTNNSFYNNYITIKKEFRNYVKTTHNKDFKSFLEKLYYDDISSDLKDQIARIYDRLYNTNIVDNEDNTIGILLGSDGIRRYSDGSISTSCNGYHTNNEPYVYQGDVGNGLYEIDPSNSGDSFIVYCDMDNGGWTLVAMLFENEKFDWNSITDINRYHTDLDSKISFILPSEYIPDHQYVGFGKDYDALFSDGVEMPFPVGDFVFYDLDSISGTKYSLYRSSEGYYDGLDYEEGKLLKTNKKDFFDCLSLDAIGVHSYSWTFCPKHKLEGYRGFNLEGNRPFKDDSAWTLWVK